MSFWKRKKNNVEPDVRVVELTVPSLTRQILHDGILGDPKSIGVELGLAPQSEDVWDMEEAASHERLHRTDTYVPLLEMHAIVMGKISMASYKLANPDKELTEDEEEEMNVLFRLLAFSSSLTSLSLLLDLGLVIPEEEIYE
jgi:hypothetical protein